MKALGSPLKRSIVPAIVIVALLCTFFILHYHDDIRLRLEKSQHKTKRKAIVSSVQRKDETTSDWIVHMLPDWEPVVYVADRTSDEPADGNSSPIQALNMPINRGREASVYLTYIIHHYHDLPDYVVFIHGKRYQLHNDEPMLDTLPLIKNLNLHHVDEEGYASLRCQWQFCPNNSMVRPDLENQDSIWEYNGLFATAWTEFFPNSTLPEKVTGPYGAQFAVSRATLRRWPIDKYERIRQWVWTAPSDYKAGLVMEAMWHVLFGKEAYFCPSARECYCKKWGLCDLECEDSGWCLGRVWVNPNRNAPMSLPPHLPDNWPEEGQSSKGDGADGWFPYNGWWEDPEVVKAH